MSPSWRAAALTNAQRLFVASLMRFRPAALIFRLVFVCRDWQLWAPRRIASWQPISFAALRPSASCQAALTFRRLRPGSVVAAGSGLPPFNSYRISAI
jgi:hypothetical protein